MKPAWDKLAAAFDGHKTALIGDVDCTSADGKGLCETHGVEGFPTIKYGDPSGLESYEGGRDFSALEKFAKENLKPMCSPTNIDLCDAEKKAEIEKFMALDDAALDALIEGKDKEIQAAEKDFEEAVKKLQETYEGLEKEKTKKLQDVKDSGLGLMKAVKASLKKKEEL